MSRLYRISHDTAYDYDDVVVDSYGMVAARPRDIPDVQRLREHELTVTPRPSDRAEHTDSEGNAGTYFHVTEPHRHLLVSARSLVEVESVVMPTDTTAWEDARPALRMDLPEAALAGEHAVPSPLVEPTAEVVAYAAESLRPGRPLVDAVVELTSRVHADFEYQPGSTDVSTRVPDVLSQRSGVCQDFAHLMIAGLRGHGLAARYVSGYLSTDPPPGRERMVGADATHAWLAVWTPGGGWVAVDPTNNCLVGDRHVTVGWGRDYGDVPPVKGVIFTEASTSTITVTVDVEPLDEPT